jgi:hypothetical protein
MDTFVQRKGDWTDPRTCISFSLEQGAVRDCSVSYSSHLPRFSVEDGTRAIADSPKDESDVHERA